MKGEVTLAFYFYGQQKRILRAFTASQQQPHPICNLHLVSHSIPVPPLILRSSYGIDLLHHLAADGTGLLGGQVAVVAVLQVDANLPWCTFVL